MRKGISNDSFHQNTIRARKDFIKLYDLSVSSTHQYVEAGAESLLSLMRKVSIIFTSFAVPNRTTFVQEKTRECERKTSAGWGGGQTSKPVKRKWSNTDSGVRLRDVGVWGGGRGEENTRLMLFHTPYFVRNRLISACFASAVLCKAAISRCN